MLSKSGYLFLFCIHDPVNRLDPSGLAYFIIHCDDFGNQAAWQADQVTSGRHIYTYRITNTEDFISLWNNRMYNYSDPIYGIFIFSHGFNHGIWFSRGDPGISMDGFRRDGVTPSPSVAYLNIMFLHGAVHLFACNVGHLDSYFRGSRQGGNFAAALSTRVTGWGAVRAFDGAVSFGTPFISPISTRITGNYRPRLASTITGGQNGFIELRNRYSQLGYQSRRSPRGVQQWRDGTLNNNFIPHPTFIEPLRK